MDSESNIKTEHQTDLKKLPEMLGFLSDIPLKLDATTTKTAENDKNLQNEALERKSEN
jgi:hypothetical protein